VWPPPPDSSRIEYVREIRCADLKPQRGWLGSVAGLIGGSSEDENLQLPFDIAVAGDKLYMTCQETPALVEVDIESKRFRLHADKGRPFDYPLAVCAAQGEVYVTDSGNGTVYRFDGEDVEPLITGGLKRPTGIAFLPDPARLYVVDTEIHAVLVFDLDGKLMETMGGRGDAVQGFNYPTFASAGNGSLLINDTMNYRVKLFDDGGGMTAIGVEGDGPGAFARPKGIAVDGQGSIYVVDALFDNVQVFSPEGRLLLVIGSAGREVGQFWSPAGIDIAGDLIYIADTFNHRIQILRILGS
jgi:DNA-binding beta-propeller fold protein YncE